MIANVITYSTVVFNGYRKKKKCKFELLPLNGILAKKRMIKIVKNTGHRMHFKWGVV